MSGTIVSPCPPSTIAWMSSTEASSASARNARNRAVSSTPAIPMTRSRGNPVDRKSTRLNSSHLVISYAVFCLKKKKKKHTHKDNRNNKKHGIDNIKYYANKNKSYKVRTVSTLTNNAERTDRQNAVLYEVGVLT